MSVPAARPRLASVITLAVSVILRPHPVEAQRRWQWMFCDQIKDRAAPIRTDNCRSRTRRWGFIRSSNAKLAWCGNQVHWRVAPNTAGFIELEASMTTQLLHRATLNSMERQQLLSAATSNRGYELAEHSYRTRKPSSRSVESFGGTQPDVDRHPCRSAGCHAPGADSSADR